MLTMLRRGASSAPEPPPPPADHACVRCEQRAGAAPTPPACDASSAPELRCPLSTRPATEPACPPQSTAPAFFSALLKNSTSARQGASGAQAHSPAPFSKCASACTSQRPSAVSHGLPVRPRASSLPRWARARCALCRLLARGHHSRRPRKSAALRGASSGRVWFWRWRPLPAPSPRGSLSLRSLGRFAHARGRRCGFAAIGARAARTRIPCVRCARSHASSPAAAA